MCECVCFGFVTPTHVYVFDYTTRVGVSLSLKVLFSPVSQLASVFQVTGRESFKADRPSRPVKIAESDVDVSASPIFCLYVCLFYRIFSQPTAEKWLASLCV